MITCIITPIHKYITRSSANISKVHAYIIDFSIHIAWKKYILNVL